MPLTWYALLYDVIFGYVAHGTRQTSYSVCLHLWMKIVYIVVYVEQGLNFKLEVYKISKEEINHSIPELSYSNTGSTHRCTSVVFYLKF